MITRLIAFVVRWLILSAAVWVAAYWVPGLHLEDWQSTLAVALALGILNVFVKPVLVVLSLPITVLSLGLFLIVINTGLLLLAGWLVDTFTSYRFVIDGFWSAVLGALVISVVSFVISRFIRPEAIARDITK